MASGGSAAPVSEGGGSGVRASGLAAAGSSMDTRTMFLLLHSVTEDNIRFFREDGSEAGRRFAWAFSQIQEQGRGLQPLVGALAGSVYSYDLDERTPANGYRSLLKVVRCCVLHLIHKARYVHSHRRSIFFRTNHNLLEVEAYCSALRQLRALTYFAQRLLASNKPGELFLANERGLSEEFLREANSMHKGCFYGRCLGFQFSPSIRPFLQTISIGLVSFGENYKRHETGLGAAANSIFTSGKYAIDPELRGSEFERLTQNLDVHFWKAFWNITETEVLASLATLTSTTVQVNKTLSVPPDPFELPLLVDPTLTLVITPPVAHSGPGAVPMRLISYKLRDGQDSDELNSFCKPQAQPSLDVRWKSKTAPRSRFLIVHFHGGGFVAHTSKSHEPYLKTWSQELESPILSVDYSLAPEYPFPRALEECFFAYCWAVKNCHLLGSTGERICLAGDSAGGNLCITVSLRAASCGVRRPDGIMAAYPATLLQATASPSRLLTFIDPLLPLSVLSKCLSAYAGMEPAESFPSPPEKADPLCVVRNEPAVLLRDIHLGATAWFNSLLQTGKSGQRPDTVRKSCSEAALGGEGSSCSSLDSDHEYVMSQTCLEPQDASPPSSGLPSGSGFQVGLEEEEEEEEEGGMAKFPEGFQPLRSGAGRIRLQTPAIVRNPFMSPLLATDDMLRGMPPVHLVACALDPMLDDSVMFAKRLRSLRMPVSLCVVEDLPHGFLSLCQVSRETREASRLCVERIRNVLQPWAHSKTERTGTRGPPADQDTGA